MEAGNINKFEITVHDKAQVNLGLGNSTIYAIQNNGDGRTDDITHATIKFKNNKKQDYIKNWNSRLFLHIDNNERPITLADAFIMPDYESLRNILGIPKKDLGMMISKLTNKKRSLTILIRGVPGIGKSSIVSWISNKYKDDERILVLRFRDWEIEELRDGLLKAILTTLECKRKELDGKILILDGFDEIKLLGVRNNLLDSLLNDILDYVNLKLIITSRKGYINPQGFKVIIDLLPFDDKRIRRFYKIITNDVIKTDKIYGEDVIGIPVVLYMAIMSGFDITKKTTKSELYNRIFAEDGGIFDKFSFEGCMYDTGTGILRSKENIKKYLKFLKRIAFIMFAKNNSVLPKKNLEIPKMKFQNEDISILEFPIKYLFEDIETNIEFIHNSIYEYFVSEYIFSTILKNINKKPNKLAKIFGIMFKERRLSAEILEFLKYKFMKNESINEKYQMIYDTFRLMLKNGMTYYLEKSYKNVIDVEMNIFANLLEIVHLPTDRHLIMELDDVIGNYIRYNRNSELNLNEFVSVSELNLNDVYLKRVFFCDVCLKNVNLKGANLQWAIIINAHITGSDLSGADLEGANFVDTDLENVNLKGANLYMAKLNRVNLRGTDLKKANLEDIELEKVKIDEIQVSIFEQSKCKLKNTIVYVRNIDDTISVMPYNEYCREREMSNIRYWIKRKNDR